MRKNKEQQEKEIARSVIGGKSTEDLLEIREWMDKFLKWRSYSKLHKTYVTGLYNALEYNGTDKVYCDYRLDGTVTGRLSCGMYSAEKPMGVSFHTLPRDTDNNIRNLFIAPDNKAFITIDYAGMELRVLAHVANDERMLEAFREGADLHTYSASLLFNKPQEKIKKEERQIAKAASFLIVYGGTAYTLANKHRLPLKRAETIIDTYMEVFPGISEYIESTYSTIRGNGYVTSIFGRKRRLPNVRSNDTKVVGRSLRQGLNFTIQSAASDIILCSIKGLSDRLKPLGADIVSTVHDSLELICPKENLKECLEVCYDEMVNTPTLEKDFGIYFKVPLKIDAEVGYSFGDGNSVDYQDGVVNNIDSLLGYFND